MYAGIENVHGWGFNTHLPLGDKDRDFIIHANAFPNYLTDLNAMHSAEKSIPADMRCEYVNELSALSTLGGDMGWGHCRADAGMRAHAMLRTLHLWDDTK
jgi:hypothetical protein